MHIKTPPPHRVSKSRSNRRRKRRSKRRSRSNIRSKSKSRSKSRSNRLSNSRRNSRSKSKSKNRSNRRSNSRSDRLSNSKSRSNIQSRSSILSNSRSKNKIIESIELLLNNHKIITEYLQEIKKKYNVVDVTVPKLIEKLEILKSWLNSHKGINPHKGGSSDEGVTEIMIRFGVITFGIITIISLVISGHTVVETRDLLSNYTGEYIQGQEAAEDLSDLIDAVSLFAQILTADD